MAGEPIPYSGPVVTRAEAKAAGLGRYFTGKLCSGGHKRERYTQSGNCLGCQEASNLGLPQYYLANAEKIRARSAATRAADPDRRKRHYAANREKQKADAAEWRAENPERVKATAAAHYARSAEKRAVYYAANKQRLLATGAKWKAENPGKRSAHHAKRRAGQAVPPWVDNAKIEEFYAEAIRLTRETGIRHEVDHIYPLDHSTCCGLHVPWNLQVLTRSQNRKKASSLPKD